jgi:hypothetical protein
MEDLLKSLE